MHGIKTHCVNSVSASLLSHNKIYFAVHMHSHHQTMKNMMRVFFNLNLNFYYFFLLGGGLYFSIGRPRGSASNIPVLVVKSLRACKSCKNVGYLHIIAFLAR